MKNFFLKEKEFFVLIADYYFQHNTKMVDVLVPFLKLVQLLKDILNNLFFLFPSYILNNSSEKGSEWNGNIEFNGKVQTGIISQMQVKLGFELKKTRKENEAKGYQAVANVSPKTVSTTNIYYGGYKSSGKLKTYTTYTATPNKRVYKTTDVNVTLYQSKILDIHTYTSEKSI